MSEKAHIYLVRHAQSFVNISPDANKNSGLTEKGKLEAKSVKNSVTKWHLDYLMSSPMSRAQQSVEILFPKRHIIFCEDLMECYPGESNQLLLSRLKRVKKYLDSLNGTIFIMSHGVFISHLTIYLIFAQLNYRNNNYLLRPIRNMHYAKLTRKGGLYSLSDYNKTFK